MSRDDTPTRDAPYGYCRKCGGAGKSRERRPNGNDTCVNGHQYPSALAIYEHQTAHAIRCLQLGANAIDTDRLSFAISTMKSSQEALLVVSGALTRLHGFAVGACPAGAVNKFLFDLMKRTG